MALDGPRCRVCGGRVEHLDPGQGQGSWWAHEHHPADGHDARPDVLPDWLVEDDDGLTIVDRD